MESVFDAGDAAIASAIRNGVSFYVDQYQRGEILTIDSLWLVLLIARNDLEYQSIAQQWYSQLPFADDFQNPFLRIFPGQKNTAFSKFRNLEIRRSAVEQHGMHDMYTVHPHWKYDKYFVDPTDDVVLKALYCDTTGYDEMDFQILQNVADSSGGYMDTHNILALRLLMENDCFSRKRLHTALISTAHAILKSVERDMQQAVIGDEVFEKLCMLFWSGFGDHVRKEWMVKVAKYQNKVDYGWSHDYVIRNGHITPMQGQQSDGHPTGLALLSLVYYELGESLQDFYPLK